LSHWFAPGKAGPLADAEVDLRVGGRYRIAFATPNGDQHEVGGTYHEVQPHSRLVFTWAWKSTPERVSRVSISLAPATGGATELRFVHDRFFDDTARANHERGWQPYFAQLEDFLYSSETTPLEA
jgi:uncharacterized protein YndB with AHSA1/START domain